MIPKPQCPFCLKEFETIEQATQHLILEDCIAQPAQDPVEPPENSSERVESRESAAG